jgi:hypothetical protein
LPIGAKVAFEAVTVEAAQAARRAHVAELEAMRSRIVPLRRSPADVALALHECNLVSGFVDAAV